MIKWSIKIFTDTYQKECIPQSQHNVLGKQIYYFINVPFFFINLFHQQSLSQDIQLDTFLHHWALSYFFTRTEKAFNPKTIYFYQSRSSPVYGCNTLYTTAELLFFKQQQEQLIAILINMGKAFLFSDSLKWQLSHS